MLYCALGVKVLTVVCICVLLVQVPDLLDGLHQKLKLITSPQTRTGTMRCVRSICQQFLGPSLTHLLSKPLPWDE